MVSGNNLCRDYGGDTDYVNRRSNLFNIIKEEEEVRKKKDRSTKEKRPNQCSKDYSRVMTENQAVRLYMAGPQILPYETWKHFKGIETYEEVYRV